MDIREFLLWLVSAAGAGAVFSFVAERIPAFQRLTAQAKSYWVLAGSLALSLGAYAILAYVPPEVLDALKPWFQVAAGVVGTWLTTQLAHSADPAARER